MKELENKIREALPHLQKIEKSQIFYSKYYGNITATKIISLSKGVYSIYGFCEEGLPRDCYYPKDLELIGKPIMLNDVLSWFNNLNISDRYYSVSFEDSYFNEINRYSDGDVKDGKQYTWNLDSPFLVDQSEELIEFLNDIDYEQQSE